MKTAAFFALLLLIPFGVRADFSYSTTRKTTGGSMASMAGNAANGVSKIYLKGQKMKIEEGDSATVIDFDAGTITSVSNARKTFAVRNMGDLAAAQAGTGITVDAKDTDQRKTINGFDSKELLVTMQLDAGQGRGMAMKMDVEADMWISSAVPGADEMRAFYRRNAAKFPWAAIGGGNNQALQSAMAELQKKIASMDGVPVQQIIRVKPGAGAQMPQMPAGQSSQMDQARAKLEALAAQGGPAAAMAKQALSRMGAASGGNSGVLIELTLDSSDFSGAAVPDSVFAIPADYQKTDR